MAEDSRMVLIQSVVDLCNYVIVHHWELLRHCFFDSKAKFNPPNASKTWGFWSVHGSFGFHSAVCSYAGVDREERQSDGAGGVEGPVCGSTKKGVIIMRVRSLVSIIEASKLNFLLGASDAFLLAPTARSLPVPPLDIIDGGESRGRIPSGSLVNTVETPAQPPMKTDADRRFVLVSIRRPQGVH
ncbi:hypothetical protein P691DRAFT_784877 [Macrolepiota fuliginosa MF-IS2]|uniref:Uncharacterized protein n=1 Tax=Macrolepiota fuliginosa MF-IS2 TaxID=1400762 RepID=A0A9P5X8M1_9AGAR|nr:hypothetical protein P691DRAFT_784877 [Macrolepiota fuliginosa MF-IS2]